MVGVEGDGLRVTTGSVDVRLPRLLTVDGRPLAGVERPPPWASDPAGAWSPSLAATIGHQAHGRLQWPEAPALRASGLRPAWPLKFAPARGGAAL